jgi:hypothetical protein
MRTADLEQVQANPGVRALLLAEAEGALDVGEPFARHGEDHLVDDVVVEDLAKLGDRSENQLRLLVASALRVEDVASEQIAPFRVLLDRLDDVVGQVTRADHGEHLHVAAGAAGRVGHPAEDHAVPYDECKGQREVGSEEEARNVLVQAEEEDGGDVDQRHGHERLRDATDLRPDRARAETVVEPEEPRACDPEQ